MDSLSLLGDEKLDVSVAFKGMVARARDVLGMPLEHLRQRFGKELREDLEVERLPFHPALFCDHFRQASDQAAIPLTARLILYKLYGRCVLEELQDLAATANQSLAAKRMTKPTRVQVSTSASRRPPAVPASRAAS